MGFLGSGLVVPQTASGDEVGAGAATQPFGPVDLPAAERPVGASPQAPDPPDAAERRPERLVRAHRSPTRLLRARFIVGVLGVVVEGVRVLALDGQAPDELRGPPEAGDVAPQAALLGVLDLLAQLLQDGLGFLAIRDRAHGTDIATDVSLSTHVVLRRGFAHLVRDLRELLPDERADLVVGQRPPVQLAGPPTVLVFVHAGGADQGAAEVPIPEVRLDVQLLHPGELRLIAARGEAVRAVIADAGVVAAECASRVVEGGVAPAVVAVLR